MVIQFAELTRRRLFHWFAAVGVFAARSARADCTPSTELIDALPSNYPGSVPEADPTDFTLRYREGDEYPTGIALLYTVAATGARPNATVFFRLSTTSVYERGTPDADSGVCAHTPVRHARGARVSSAATSDPEAEYRIFSGSYIFATAGTYEVLLKSPDAPAIVVTSVYVGKLP